MSMTPRYDVLETEPFRWSSVLLQWEFILALLLVGVIIMGSVISPYFFDVWTLSDATFNFSEKALIALPLALLILTREIDLSVAAIIALSSLAMGLCAGQGYGPWSLAAIGMIVGLLCGMFNGVLVTKIGLPSIVVTIGTMSLFRGLAQVVLGDQAITTYPAGFSTIGQGYIIKWPPIAYSFGIFLIFASVFAIILHRTATGRRLFAIGNNPSAAKFSGIAVERMKLALFCLTGLMAGLAAVLLTSRIGSTRSNIALGWELDIITMVILGGVSISGGVGSIGGVVLAVFVLGLATLALSLINVPGIVISVLMGFLLIFSIAAPIFIKRVMGLRA
jgi:rhamnose transport system permease protein